MNGVTDPFCDFLLYSLYISKGTSTGKTKYMEIGRQRGMIANEHIRVDSHSYESSDNNNNNNNNNVKLR